MDINRMRAFFKWCTILNGGLLILSSLLIRFGGGWVFGIHSRWIHLAPEEFRVAIYLLLGFFKLLVIVFNLVPYLALVIIGRDRGNQRF